MNTDVESMGSTSKDYVQHVKEITDYNITAHFSFLKGMLVSDSTESVSFKRQLLQDRPQFNSSGQSAREHTRLPDVQVSVEHVPTLHAPLSEVLFAHGAQVLAVEVLKSLPHLRQSVQVLCPQHPLLDVPHVPVYGVFGAAQGGGKGS